MLILVIFSLFGCNDQPLNTLNKNDLITVDTLYKNQVTALRKTLDSICEAKHDSLVAIAADSMMLIRLKEIAKQRARFEQQK